MFWEKFMNREMKREIYIILEGSFLRAKWKFEEVRARN